MKYLAILKDSLREALDTKVFFVMVALSCVVLLAVASVSYRPVTVEDEAKTFAATATWMLNARGRQPGDEPATVAVADYRETNPDAPPWQRDYRFSLVVHDAHAKAKRAGDAEAQAQAQAEANHLRFMLGRQLPYLNELKVVPATSDDPAATRYDASSHGTKIADLRDWPHEPTLFFALPIKFWHAPVGRFVYFWENTLINSIGAAVTLLVSTIITAFFIPNMLRKGTVDLLLVKPIHRSTLLVYKYIGGLAFMFLNTTFVVAGVWLILGLRTGLWSPGFLVSIFVLTYLFAFYYAISTFFGVLTRSAIVSILMTCLAWFVFAVVLGLGYQIIDTTRKLPELAAIVQREGGPPLPKEPPLPDWAYTTADAVHFVTPRVKDLDALNQRLIVTDTLPEYSEERRQADLLFADLHWGESVGVMAIYIVALLALSCWRFATKEY